MRGHVQVGYCREIIQAIANVRRGRRDAVDAEHGSGGIADGMPIGFLVNLRVTDRVPRFIHDTEKFRIAECSANSTPRRGRAAVARNLRPWSLPSEEAQEGNTGSSASMAADRDLAGLAALQEEPLQLTTADVRSGVEPGMRDHGENKHAQRVGRQERGAGGFSVEHGDH